MTEQYAAPRAYDHADKPADKPADAPKADAPKADAPKAKAKAKPGPLTGVVSVYDVIRHLITHGPARNDAERAELAAAVDATDPDYTEPEHVPTEAEKAAEWDKLQAEKGTK
jgi:hypothetical protein